MFEIIDNFLSQEDFLYIKNTFFPQDLKNSDNFSWYYQKGIVRGPELGPTGYDEQDWIYTHPLYSADNGLKFDKYYSLSKPILNKLKVKKLFIVRAYLLISTPKHIYHEFHTDRSDSHKVALFYVTTSNGFTVIENTAEVKCVENRMLLFDGHLKHQSVTSTDSPRCVININYF